MTRNLWISRNIKDKRPAAFSQDLWIEINIPRNFSDRRQNVLILCRGSRGKLAWFCQRKDRKHAKEGKGNDRKQAERFLRTLRVAQKKRKVNSQNEGQEGTVREKRV